MVDDAGWRLNLRSANRYRLRPLAPRHEDGLRLATMQLDLFPTDVRLRWIDPVRNMRRFATLSIQPTLFGEWALVCETGRLGQAGRVSTDRYPSAGQAIDALCVLAHAKRRRGYVA